MAAAKLAKPESAAASPYPKVKAPKIPKSLGAAVDLYHERRQMRLEAKRHMEALEEVEKAIYNHILDNIPKGDAGAVGKNYKAVRQDKMSFSIENDADFYAFIKRTGSFDLLNRAINQRAVADRLEDPKFMKKHPNGVPGTKGFKVFTLSVTKTK